MASEKKRTLKKNSFEAAIETACKGLFYISETDAEIVPFFGGKSIGRSRETILKVLGSVKAVPIEERSFGEFFGRLTKIHDWFTPVEIRNAERFLDLRKLLEENLKDLIVLRTGRIQIDIYVVGIDKNGNLVGIRTKSIET